MPTPNSSLTVREITPEVRVIDISGEITAHSEDEVNAAHEEASQGGVSSVVLNFEGLDYMNSGGIGVLVTVLIRARRRGHRLLACGLTEHYREIFSLTRLDEAIRHLRRRDSRAKRRRLTAPVGGVVPGRAVRPGHESMLGCDSAQDHPGPIHNVDDADLTDPADAH